MVTFARLTEEQVAGYVASGEGWDKAGAYAIQENGDRFVTIVSGSFSNVVGLPLELLDAMWKEWSEPQRTA